MSPLCHRIRCIVFNYFSKVLNRFKYRHNACFKGNCLHLFVCSSKSFQIPLERMLQRHCFQLFTCSSKSFQIVSECMLQRHYFQNDSCGSESFQIRQNACFRDIVFICCFSAVPNRFKYHQMHALETLFSKLALQFQIISNTVRMHAVETLFSIFSLQFQIV